MNKTYTLYLDQLKKVIAQVEETSRKTPLAEQAITLVVSDEDPCVKMFQKVGHDWHYLSDIEFCEWK